MKCTSTLSEMEGSKDILLTQNSYKIISCFCLEFQTNAKRSKVAGASIVVHIYLSVAMGKGNGHWLK